MIGPASNGTGGYGAAMAELPAIPPDNKDWTWVLQQGCPECRFDAQSFARESVGDMLRGNARKWDEILARGEEIRERPRPDKWSPLEYACHVRDLCMLYAERLDLMLHADGPHFPDWDQNITAREKRYDLCDPADVRMELAHAAEILADKFDAVSGDQWLRPGYRGDGASFTVESLARYFIHDPTHHLWDVEVG